MQDRELYEKLLGLKEPWFVEKVSLDLSAANVTVIIGHPKGASFPCPVCGKPSPVYDHQKRRWRHLDTCGFTTILEAEVPRISCSDHGVKQVTVAWGEPGSRFTALFEAVAISLLKIALLSDLAQYFNKALGKMRVSGFRNRVRSKMVILFQLGGLSMLLDVITCPIERRNSQKSLLKCWYEMIPAVRYFEFF